MTLLEVKNLTKLFPTATGDEKRAVDGISFAVRGGEIFGLLGPNGAGKTTTLRILSGLMEVSSGSALVGGIEVTEDPERARSKIGWLTANTGLYQRLTPREVLAYFAELNHLPPARIKSRVEHLISWLEMESFADLRCGSLSTGQQQRTKIARSLVADPPILILDEPTLGLDVLTNRIILSFIRHEREQGKAILLSTHYLDEAEALCDTIGLLHEGALLQIGTMEQLRAVSGCDRLTEVFLKLIKQSAASSTEDIHQVDDEPPRFTGSES